jgi:methylphosphotriester-DNA--protein-cysteine methyltransferase
MNKQKQAFPLHEQTSEYSGVFQREPGMTLREYYAGLAMQGLLANFSNTNYVKSIYEHAIKEKKDINDVIAKMATEFADDLISELQKDR